MIPEIDIWRAANLMLKRYGDNAPEESATRVDELTAAGDDTAPRPGAGSPPHDLVGASEDQRRDYVHVTPP